MKSIRSTFIVALLGTSVLAGCKGKAGVDINKLSMSSFDAVMAVNERTTPEAEVKSSLETLKLNDVSGPFNWDNVAIDGSKVSFNGFANDAGTLSAENMILSGVHAGGFDKIELRGVDTFMKFEANDIAPDMPTSIRVTTDVLIAANPNKDGAVDFIESLSGDDLTMLMTTGFNGARAQNMSIYLGDQKIGHVKSSSTGRAADGTFYTYAENFNMDMTDFMGNLMADAGTPMPEIKMSMNFGTMKTTGMSEGYVKAMRKMLEGNLIMSGSAMRDMTYDRMILENSTGEIMGAKLDMPLMDATGSKSGDVFTQKQTIKGATMSFDDSNPQVASVLTDLGMMTMPFDGFFVSSTDFANDTMKISEGRVDFKDQFALNILMDTSGMMAYQEKLAELGLDGITADPEAVAAIPMYDINNISLAITDQSIMERVWKMAAKMQQMDDPEMMKSQAKGLLAMGAMGAGTEAERKLMGQVSGAVNKFIDQNGTLTVGMSPSKGFFKMVENPDPSMDPNKMIESMGLTISHTPPKK